MSIIDEIKNRIKNMSDGDIMMSSDFADLSSITTVRKCLGRCVDEGIIRRVFNGVYEKPKYSKFLKEYLPTDPEKVAHALAKNYHWTIAPCGDIALNKLGLTTQVPTVWSYISDGPYRSFEWDNIKLTFKHKTNREISKLSYQTVLLAEAIRTLGKDRVTEEVVVQLKKRFSKQDRELILVEATNCSEWIFEAIRKVCAA